jgi:two-component system nitrate/nitrite response regulator NarL
MTRLAKMAAEPNERLGRVSVVMNTPELEDCLREMLLATNGTVELFSRLDDLPELLARAEAPSLIVVGVGANAAEDFDTIASLQTISPSSRWIVLCPVCSELTILQAIAASVDGLLPRHSPFALTKLACELVLAGHLFISKRHARPLRRAPLNNGDLEARARSLWQGATDANGSSAQTNSAVASAEKYARAYMTGEETVQSGRKFGLSEREMQILACVAEGSSNKLIARDLNITEATVKVHVKTLLKKMQVANRTQAALSASKFLPSHHSKRGNPVF